MSLTITHPFVSAIADDPVAAAAGQVVPSNWNATHTISGTLPSANIAPAGSTTQVQFNLAGVMSADSGLTYAGSSGAISFGTDIFLNYDSAGILGFSRGAPDSGTVTSPAALRMYNLASSSLTNYERMEVGFAAHSNVAAIDVAAGGTGTVRNFGIYIGGTLKLDYNITHSGSWTTPTTIFTSVLATEGLIVGQLLTWGNNSQTASATTLDGRTNGSLTVYNFADTNSFTVSAPTATAIPTLQLGALDAASPVAQTLSVQNVVGGTTATNGVNWTLIGSRSTGTGISGDIIFQTGLNPGSGTTQAAATTALTIKGESQAVWLSGTLVDKGYTYVQPTTGQTVTLGNKDWHTIIDPAGALLALTVQMPASPVDGQLIDFKVSQAITTLTVSPNSGQSVVGGPAAGASVAGITYNAIYCSTNTTWYF